VIGQLRHLIYIKQSMKWRPKASMGCPGYGDGSDRREEFQKQDLQRAGLATIFFALFCANRAIEWLWLRGPENKVYVS